MKAVRAHPKQFSSSTNDSTLKPKSFSFSDVLSIHEWGNLMALRLVPKSMSNSFIIHASQREREKALFVSTNFYLQMVIPSSRKLNFFFVRLPFLSHFIIVKFCPFCWYRSISDRLMAITKAECLEDLLKLPSGRKEMEEIRLDKKNERGKCWWRTKRGKSFLQPHEFSVSHNFTTPLYGPEREVKKYTGEHNDGNLRRRRRKSSKERKAHTEKLAKVLSEKFAFWSRAQIVFSWLVVSLTRKLILYLVTELLSSRFS